MFSTNLEASLIFYQKAGHFFFFIGYSRDILPYNIWILWIMDEITNSKHRKKKKSQYQWTLNIEQLQSTSMEISSAISERWRSLTLASFMGCILFIYIITLNNPTINLVISSSSVVTLSTMEEQPQSLSSAIVVTDTEQVSPTIAQKEIKQRANRIGKKCDINDGKWVHKPEGKPVSYTHLTLPTNREV